VWRRGKKKDDGWICEQLLELVCSWEQRKAADMRQRESCGVRRAGETARNAAEERGTDGDQLLRHQDFRDQETARSNPGGT